jgi:hypothetical protein
MPPPPDEDLGRHPHRGAYILRRVPPRSRRQRLTALLKRTRLLIAAAVAVALTGIGLLNASLDLWGKVRGPQPTPTESIQAGFQTGGLDLLGRALWRDGQTGCTHALSGEDLPLFQEPRPGGHDPTPDEGEIGDGHTPFPAFATSPLVHPEVIDVDPVGFNRKEFLAQGAYVAENQVVRVVIANRSDLELVVTDITLDVERHPAPNGTVMIFPGGDFSETNIISFDLREDRPVARVVGDDCLPADPFFGRYAFTIDAGRTELFDVEILAADCLCLVRLTVDYWHRGQWRALSIPEGESAPIPVTRGGSTRYQMLYIDHTYTDNSQPNEKYDCREQAHELCEPAG